jgi:type VI protein secretion system component VasK
MTPSEIWVPALVTLAAMWVVVFIAAWWNARSLSDHIRMLESKLDARVDSIRSEIQAMRAEVKQSMAELELRLTKQAPEASERLDRIDEPRGPVQP